MNLSQFRVSSLALAAGFLVTGASVASAFAPATTTFESGTEGWSVSGREDISPTGGNPGANMSVELLDVFGADIRNDSNPAFQGNYTALGGPIKLSVDVKIDSIDFFGQQVSRDMVVELRDTSTDPGTGLPYVSVWYNLGTLEAAQPGWRHFEVTIDYPNSATLPAGWGGYGDETPLGEPILPANRTFASVLASVTELHFTTFVPGFFFGFTNFVMAVDNPTVSVVPEPTAICGIVCVGLLALRRRRATGI